MSASSIDTAKRLKRGVRFLHKYWLDTDHKPMLCEVTRVYLTIVYWKQPGTRKAHNYFYMDEADKYVGAIIET